MDVYRFIDREGGKSFEFRVRLSDRAKTLLVLITKDRRVIVTIPRRKASFVRASLVTKFLDEKKKNIFAVLEKYERLAKLYPDLFDFSREHYLRYKEAARDLIQRKVDYYAKKYDFKYKRLSIRNQMTRWGSCSVSGGLNFSYRLLFLQPEEQDYIIVHELCHLRQPNHSGKFWREVEKILPNYKDIHQSLKAKS